jgi:hypothetical protein
MVCAPCWGAGYLCETIITQYSIALICADLLDHARDIIHDQPSCHSCLLWNRPCGCCQYSARSRMYQINTRQNGPPAAFHEFSVVYPMSLEYMLH